MTIYKDRLVTAMALADVKPAALAEQLGVSYQAVMKVLTGKSAYFDTPNNVRAARFLGVASDWLATGDDASGTQVPKVPIYRGPSERASNIAFMFDKLTQAQQVQMSGVILELIVQAMQTAAASRGDI